MLGNDAQRAASRIGGTQLWFRVSAKQSIFSPGASLTFTNYLLD